MFTKKYNVFEIEKQIKQTFVQIVHVNALFEIFIVCHIKGTTIHIIN